MGPLSSVRFCVGGFMLRCFMLRLPKENGHFSIFWISAVRAAPNFGIFALGRDFCALHGGNKEKS